MDNKIFGGEFPPLGKHAPTAESGHMLSKLGRVLGSWVPFLGAIGLGALTAYDTDQVARTARNVFG